jgi:hypothetical protein
MVVASCFSVAERVTLRGKRLSVSQCHALRRWERIAAKQLGSEIDSSEAIKIQQSKRTFTPRKF